MAVPAALPLQPTTAAPQAGVSGRAPGAKPGFAAAMAAAGAVKPETVASGAMAPLVLGTTKAGAVNPGEDTTTIDPAGLAALLLGATVVPAIPNAAAVGPTGGEPGGAAAIAVGAATPPKASGPAVATPLIAAAAGGITTTGSAATGIATSGIATTGITTTGTTTNSGGGASATITGAGGAEIILGGLLETGAASGATPKSPGATTALVQPPTASAPLSIPASAIPASAIPIQTPTVPVAQAAKPGGKARAGGDGTAAAPRVAGSVGAFPSGGSGASSPATVASPIAAVARVEKAASPPSPLLAGNAIVATAAVRQVASGTPATGKRAGVAGGAGSDGTQSVAGKVGPSAVLAAATLAARDPGSEPPKAVADTPTPLGDLAGATPSARPTPPQGAGVATAHDGRAEVPRPPAEQIALHIRTAVRHGTDRISIQLHPDSLGSIDITLKLRHDGQVTATVTADRADTYDLLQRDARGLERALQDAGLRTDPGGLSFNLRGDGRGAQGSPRQPIHVAPAPIASDDLVLDDTSGALRRPAANLDRALDIHV